MVTRYIVVDSVFFLYIRSKVLALSVASLKGRLNSFDHSNCSGLVRVTKRDFNVVNSRYIDRFMLCVTAWREMLIGLR